MRLLNSSSSPLGLITDKSQQSPENSCSEHLNSFARKTMSGLQDAPGTLDYLTDAAHLLRTVAPETSAHLMSQRNQLLSEHNVHLSDIQRQHVCRACGNIMIPDQDLGLKLETQKAERKRQQKGRAKQAAPLLGTRTKVISCRKCNKNTRVDIPSPRPPLRFRGKGKTGSKVTASSSGSPSAVETPKATANASSKKRAKNRKAGLQALLSGQKSQQSNPLSLADFMKK